MPMPLCTIYVGVAQAAKNFRGVRIYLQSVRTPTLLCPTDRTHGDMTVVRPIRNKANLTSNELKEWVTLLHQEGKTDQYIADYIGIDRGCITKIRNAMALPASWGKSKTRFSTAEDKEILILRNDNGLTWAAIARRLGRDTLEARFVATRYQQLEDERMSRGTKSKPVQKACLRCKNLFTTTHPRQEWYCQPHRESAASYGLFADECRIAL
jgi:hypothetical protein